MKNKLFFCLIILPLWLQAQNADISGSISNRDGKKINNVEVKLYDKQGLLLATTYTENGRYSFTKLPAGSTYTLQLNKAGSPLNGLSTFDMVIISRHILAVESLPTSFEESAADIDGSGSISITDLLYLRQLILGLAAELPDQRNWLFLPEDQLTPVAQQTNAFSFMLDEDLTQLDFLILKIGDVNGTAEYE